MKIALISTTLPPDRCGIGDHSAKLCEWLVKGGQDLAVWTKQTKPIITSKETQIHIMQKNWSIALFMQVAQEIANWGPHVTLIQFSPHLFSKSGGVLNFFLPFFILKLKLKTKKPVAMIAHELHYPIEFSFHGIFRGIPQWITLLLICFVADFTFFTYEKALKKVSNLFSSRNKNFFWLPVGANILPHQDILVDTRFDKKTILLYFGNTHYGHYFQFMLAALDHCIKILGPQKVLLVFAGIEEKNADEELGKRRSPSLKDHTLACGYLSPPQVSAWLKRADIILAPFLDGVSTRRTTVMAALAHGKPVVSTWGHLTDPSFGWESVCKLAPVHSEIQYANAVVELVQNKDLKNQFSQAAKTCYEQKLAWPILIRNLLSHFQT